MSSMIQKKKSIALNVILGVDTETKAITVEGDGIEEPMYLADVLSEFDKMDVKINVTQSEEIA